MIKLTRSVLREILSSPYPDNTKQVEYSDDTTQGLKLIRYPSGKMVFYSSFSHKGKKIRKRIGDTSLVSIAEARAFVIGLKSKLNLGDMSVVHGSMAFTELAEMFLEHSQKVHKSYHTNVSRYKQHVESYFKGIKVEGISEPLVDEFYHQFIERNSVSLANRVVNLIKSVLTYGVRKKYLPVSPIKGFRLKKEMPSRESKALSTIESKKVLEALLLEPNRDYANCIRFLLYTGLRLGEAQKIRFENVDCLKKCITLIETKSGGDRKLPISNEALLVILDQQARHGKSGLVFRASDGISKLPTPYRFLAKICEKIGIEKIGVHSLRHTAASQLLLVTDVYTVKDVLGHSSIKTTERYAKVSEERVRLSMEGLGKLIGG